MPHARCACPQLDIFCTEKPGGSDDGHIIGAASAHVVHLLGSKENRVWIQPDGEDSAAQHDHQEAGNEHIHGDDKNHGSDYRLSG
jgi:hypothetical protein